MTSCIFIVKLDWQSINTFCLYGKNLIKAILYNTDIPNQCYGCYPYNPEDSMKFENRPNYIKKEW